MPNEFKIQDERFTDIFINDFCGFYDWLRNDNANIIGVRFSGFDFTESFISIMMDELNLKKNQIGSLKFTSVPTSTITKSILKTRILEIIEFIFLPIMYMPLVLISLVKRN